MTASAMALHVCPTCGTRQWVRSKERSFACVGCSATLQAPAGASAERDRMEVVVLEEPAGSRGQDLQTR